MGLSTKATVPLIISAFMMVFLGACAPIAEKPAPPGQSGPAFPLDVTDQMGRQVSIEKIPQRIISLTPSNTEILFALGLADRVVAVSDYSDYPPEAKEKPSIGGHTPSLEEIIALSPDLILATDIHKEEVIPRLEELGLTVLALVPKTVDGVLDAITLVGEVTRQKEEASMLVAEMQNRIRAVTDKTDGLPEGQRPKVFFAVWHDPLMAPGSGTFQDDLIDKAGGTNIARNLTGWVTISLEAVIAANPEVMIAGVGEVNAEDVILQFIRTEPRLRNTDARRNNRVYGVDTDLVSRPGPRIVDGLEQLARMIHPELFE